MIYDKMSNLKLYKGMNKNLERAAPWQDGYRSGQCLYQCHGDFRRTRRGEAV